jgi:hypothetical protein
MQCNWVLLKYVTNNEKLNVTHLLRFRPIALIASKIYTTHHWHPESRNSLCYFVVSFSNPPALESSTLFKYFPLNIL